MAKIAGCKVFSVETAKNAQEDHLGHQITKWIEKNPFCQIEDRMMVQSDAFLSVMIFFSGQGGSTNPLDR